MSGSNIQKLIAFASRVELKSKVGEERVMLQKYVFSPLIHNMEIPASNIDSRSKLKAKFWSLLNSIANLAASAPQHEVYAVALPRAPSSLQLVVARNAVVPKKTTKHIETLWQYLKILAEDYAQFHKLSDTAESPPQTKKDKLPPSTRGRIIQLEREALKFCGKKLYRRFSKHLVCFKQIDCSGLPPKSRFLDIYKELMALTQGLKKRANYKDDNWERFADLYHGLDCQVTLLLEENLTYFYERMKKDFLIDQYLMKVTAFSKDIKILLNCANLPHMLRWFRSGLTIQAIVPSESLNFPLPNSPDE